jgi:uncharacterized protein YecE (DUF72 family)
MSKIWIGTSGWMYDDWRGPFYPDDAPKKSWLQWYGGKFNTTEINSSFYRTPSAEAVQSWRDSTPEDFLFAWKASKFVTHWKRLGDNCRNSIELMETRLKILGSKAGPVLFQLPPRFTANRKLLASFLRMLPKRYQYAFEFRDLSWYDDAIFEVLGNRDIALCFSDHKDAPAPWKATASHIYVRGHGPSGQYRDRYSAVALQSWANAAAIWKRNRRDVYFYFDNDQKSAAPLDALQMARQLEKR